MVNLETLPRGRVVAGVGAVLIALNAIALQSQTVNYLLGGIASRNTALFYGTGFLLPALLAIAFIAGRDGILVSIVALLVGLLSGSLAALGLPHPFSTPCWGSRCIYAPGPWILSWWAGTWYWHVLIILGSIGLILGGVSNIVSALRRTA